MLVAAAGAAALTPRHNIELLHGRKLDSIVPMRTSAAGR